MYRVTMMAAATLAAGIVFAEGGAWNPGEPVVTYWFGPGCPGKAEKTTPLTDTWAKQLKEGGFNTVWASSPEELDIAAKYGFRVIYSVDPKTEWAKVDLDDPAQKAALTERINRVKNHPALYIYEHYDEASTLLFPDLARVKEFINTLDPDHACWHNLLPTYANNKQLGVGGEEKLQGVEGDIIRCYWEHVRLFCDIYQPELITYDHYQLKTAGESPNYFLNLGIVRQNAAAWGVPFWNGLQACTWTPGSLASPKSPRIPGIDEMRYLAHTTAAYGAHGLYWYVYCRTGHKGTIAELDGTTGEKYEGLKTIHREFVAFAKALKGLSFRGAFTQGIHAPGTTPYGAQALLKISPAAPQTEIEPLQRLSDTMLVTRFEACGKPTHLMVVNCDYVKDRTLHFTAPSAAERFDPLSNTWSPVGKEFDLAFVRGGGILLRLASERTK